MQVSTTNTCHNERPVTKRPCKRSAPGVKIDLNCLLDVQRTRRDWTHPVCRLILGVSAIAHNYSAVCRLEGLINALCEQGTEMIFARVTPELAASLCRHELDRHLGSCAVYVCLYGALTYIESAQGILQRNLRRVVWIHE